MAVSLTVDSGADARACSHSVQCAGRLRSACSLALIGASQSIAAPLGLGLAAAGANVVDVPATLAARARLLTTGGGRKTDATDAASVARVALHHHRLNPVQPEDQSTILRLLTEHRDDLTHERTRILNRLHGLLRDLVPGGAPTGLSADKAATALRGVRPANATDACRRDIARHLLAALRRIDAQLKNSETELSQAVTATGSSLTELPGVGVIMAAKILGYVGDVARFPNADHVASYTGAAPTDASSGPRKRHRLNTGGNRQLNSALHIIAVVQAHHSHLGRAYYQRILGEGKTPAEARRALKRRLANIIYRRILKIRNNDFSATS
ncbi:IS110 family transposase [Micromonospora gifhornensis]|uniref:IS110 family transposase n=1 Tax=Micromonospora gifhornensis TaxID=84594 RepID=UPI001EF289D0|nr:IS110 family transposase [Micromonospora gifhornensis]